MYLISNHLIIISENCVNVSYEINAINVWDYRWECTKLCIFTRATIGITHCLMFEFIVLLNIQVHEFVSSPSSSHFFYVKKLQSVERKVVKELIFISLENILKDLSLFKENTGVKRFASLSSFFNNVLKYSSKNIQVLKGHLQVLIFFKLKTTVGIVIRFFF